MAMSFKASNFYSINYKMLPVKSGFYWFKIFSNFPLSGNGVNFFLYTSDLFDMTMSMNKPIKYWITHKPQRRLKKQRRREGKQTQWNKHKENPRKQWLTGSCGEHIIYYGWFMADLLRLIYGLFIIADFLSFVFFFLTSPKCYEMEDRNSPGLDLCSWCIIISLRCDYVVQLWGVLASRRLGATKLRPDAWLTTTGIKMPPFYYNVRSTIQLTLKTTSSPPSETCNGSSTNIWINRSTVASTQPERFFL